MSSYITLDSALQSVVSLFSFSILETKYRFSHCPEKVFEL